MGSSLILRYGIDKSTRPKSDRRTKSQDSTNRADKYSKRGKVCNRTESEQCRTIQSLQEFYKLDGETTEISKCQNGTGCTIRQTRGKKPNYSHSIGVFQ